MSVETTLVLPSRLEGQAPLKLLELTDELLTDLQQNP